MKNSVVKKRWASVYENHEFIEFCTNSGYRIALADPLGKRIQFLNPTENGVIGDGLLDVLNESRFINPSDDPDFFDFRGRVVPQYEEWVKSVINRFGYKTRKAVFKEMKYCSIEEEGGMLTIRPWHHAKTELWTGDGIADDSLVRVRYDADPAEIGIALRVGLSRCT